MATGSAGSSRRIAVIVSAARTPIGRAYRGAFNNLEAPSLAGVPIAAAVDELLTGTRAELAIKIFGPDMEVLKKKAEEVEALAASVANTDGVYLVPAFVGLGAPHWSDSARGTSPELS